MIEAIRTIRSFSSPSSYDPFIYTLRCTAKLRGSMNQRLLGKKVAILVENGFEQVLVEANCSLTLSQRFLNRRKGIMN